jgi:hypothetical protein
VVLDCANTVRREGLGSHRRHHGIRFLTQLGTSAHGDKETNAASTGMKRFWILSCSTLIACYARSIPPSTPAPTPANSCEVLVSSREARITFPSPSRSTWTWNRQSDGRPDYVWTVYLVAPGIHIEVGRNAKGPERHDDLATMLRSSTVIITWPSSGPAEFDEFRVISALHPTVSGDHPVLVIRDPAFLHELFGLNHPKEADCRFWTPDSRDTLSVWDSVRYVRFP